MIPVASSWEPPPGELETVYITERPSFETHDQWFVLDGRVLPPGLYYHTLAGKHETKLIDIWVCSPIHADAQACDEQDMNWGLLLRFMHPKGRWHEWAMPMRWLRGNGEELRDILLNMGLRINPDYHRLLHQWLGSARPSKYVTASARTGWYQLQEALIFVFPHRVIGSSQVCFQSEHGNYCHDFKSAGSLQGWQERVAALCINNPMLQFVVSAAFAGPLLKRAKQHEGGLGVHLVGDSSKGKTTALHVAASVWGAPSFVRSWRATGNGLESVATTLNDTLLVLDEISECDPHEIGNMVYALSNGVGKQRANREGASKSIHRWRLMWLSSGERTLGAHMREANQQTKAGQQVRLLDIPATHQTHGTFDDLHDYASGSAFADSLNQGYQLHYGHAGIQFVECLIADKQNLHELYTQMLNLPAFAAKDSLVGRAAKAFALMGMAGELAISYAIIPWAPGSALNAASLAYHLWRDSRDSGYSEDQQILKAIEDFIERYGEVRFSPLRTELKTIAPIHDRAGFWKDGIDGRVYYFFPAALERIAAGFEKSRIGHTLEQAGWLYDRDKDKRTKKVTLPDGMKVGLYAIQTREIEKD